jgi:hypothetical protein
MIRRNYKEGQFNKEVNVLNALDHIVSGTLQLGRPYGESKVTIELPVLIISDIIHEINDKYKLNVKEGVPFLYAGTYFVFKSIEETESI